MDLTVFSERSPYQFKLAVYYQDLQIVPDQNEQLVNWKYYDQSQPLLNNADKKVETNIKKNWNDNVNEEKGNDFLFVRKNEPYPLPKGKKKVPPIPEPDNSREIIDWNGKYQNDHGNEQKDKNEHAEKRFIERSFKRLPEDKGHQNNRKKSECEIDRIDEKNFKELEEIVNGTWQ